ncbi:MAG: glycogen/starch/alpha-glucan family phosphorylase [Rickettsiales bacterium]|jgi:starch phosphorylase|nr:glycogen/starch/alpha-glucan family phosphorylase [Rickettsiales bacterium]
MRATRLENPADFRDRLKFHLERTLKVKILTAASPDWYDALVLTLNEELSRLGKESEAAALASKRPFAAYLSMEYLLGTLGLQTLLNLNVLPQAVSALASLGADADKVLACDVSTQLGNGGLGRLAACFMDSVASKGLPVFGYGLFYRCGIYKQGIDGGTQVETPDLWWREHNLAVIKHTDIGFKIPFGGKVVEGKKIEDLQWRPAEEVKVQARDVMIAGATARSVATIRLWDAERKDKSAPDVWKKITNITDFLYPPDNTDDGRRLRLRQEYVLVAASVADIFDRFRRTKLPINEIEKYVKIQLNDTHPALAVPEVVRILMQDFRMDYKSAFAKMYKICAYTNHTLMAEALEKIGTDLFREELPYHLALIERINEDFLALAARRIPKSKLAAIEIVNREKGYVNMGNLCISSTHKVNGVAKLHSSLLKKKEFKLFDTLFPGKFINETNGISQRRWLEQANPRLAVLITEAIGDGWLTNLYELKKLKKLRRDEGFLTALLDMKYANKVALFAELERELGVKLNPKFMLDAQIKRIHEYKRQFLNVLQVIHRYNRIVDGDTRGLEPRVVLFAGKAPPTYAAAKDIVSLINGVAAKVNSDPRADGLLKVVFVPNYNIDRAEKIIRAAELSEQISTAGKEASGTGNMKFALNGALTVGTLDGANVEIKNAVGRRNIFIFGLTAPEVYRMKSRGYDAQKFFDKMPELQRIIRQIKGGFFGGDHHEILLNAFFGGGDEYMLLPDFRPYIRAQAAVDRLYRNPLKWAGKMLANIANSGFFSSDRAIDGYARDIWGISPID